MSLNTLRYLPAALLMAASNVIAGSAGEIAKSAFASTVLVVTEDDHGRPLALGSGFVLRAGAIVTNMHVIEGASRGYVKQIDSKTKHNVEGILRADVVHDLAVLSVPTISAPAVTVGDSTAIAVGDTVYAVGNPRGLEGTFSQGIVSSVRKFDSDTILQITAPISPGSSGGPVLNDRGEVVGVAVATFKGGQNLNFAIPASYLAGVALAAKPTSFGSSVKTPKVKSLLAEIGGSKSTEGVSGGQLLWDNGFDTLGGGFTISVRNSLRESVQKIYCVIIFYDARGTPLDFAMVRYDGAIPGGLAKRVRGTVDESVKKLTTPTSRENQYMLALTPSTKVEFRILDFSVETE